MTGRLGLICGASGMSTLVENVSLVEEGHARMQNYENIFDPQMS